MTPSIPSAYYLCSEAECQERQSSGEISIFESQWPPPQPSASTSLQRGVGRQLRRIVNPQFAMTKYRRSAAGVDTKNRTLPRSFDQLSCCLDQLEYILCHQQQPPTNACDKNNPFPKQTLTGTVSFVEDRIRAIQVDMIVSQQPSAELQCRIVQCHILILYLLGNVTGYEAKFGHQALSAALTNYWEDPHKPDNKDDETLCFLALHQLCQYYQAGQDDQSTLSFILGYFRSNVKPQHRQLSKFPKFQWALELVHLAVMGRPRSLLRQLVEMGGKSNSTPASFAILCRCCVAPIVDLLRFQTLEQCNKSYMKGEKVKAEEIARFLYYNSPEEAAMFAETMAGLTRKRDDGEDKIVFKLVPVSKSDKMGLIRQDEFVFGEYYGNWAGWKHQEEREVPSAWDDDPAEPTAVADQADNNPKAYTGASNDAEGVRIPPSTLLYRILRGEDP